MAYNNYLTEELLGKFLEERFKEKFIHDKAVPNSNTRLRPDYRSDDLMLIIEFDGYKHYNSSKVILNDSIKNKVYINLGYTIIRIPYFIQLDKRIIELLFGDLVKDKSDFNNYPHGFIDKNALLPADFCILGMYRFMDDQVKFSAVLEDIINSLNNKVKLLGDERLVYPVDSRGYVEKVNKINSR